jgi:tetratricopeptide (TPR) repeat protein
MARIACTTVVIILLNVLVGCRGVDSGRSQLIPPETKRPGPSRMVNIGDAGETDIIEQMAVNRQAYQKGLEMLVTYYTKTGNNMKLQWATKELEALNKMPKYNYIIVVDPPGSNLEPSVAIPEADDLYYEAMEIKKKAGPLGPIQLLKDADQLRLALAKFNELIKKHPSSDKVDDAAFEAGEIYEHFKDYTIALSYYKRTYEWDKDGFYPARFQAARILDKHLHRNAEALELYQQAVAIEGQQPKYREWKQYAEGRIRALQKADEDVEKS